MYSTWLEQNVTYIAFILNTHIHVRNEHVHCMFGLSIIDTIINVNKSQENSVNNIALVQGQSHTHTISVTGYALMLEKHIRKKHNYNVNNICSHTCTCTCNCYTQTGLHVY